jgi:hypothetical protein
MEHPIGNMIEQMSLELKVDGEINVCPVPNRREGPSVGQVLQWSFDGAHQNLSRPIQRDLAGEAFLEWTEPDDEVGDYLPLVLTVDTSAAAPRHEQGIVLYICNDPEKLVGIIGEHRLFLVTRHVTPTPLAVPETQLAAAHNRARRTFGVKAGQ